ncbi:hypothetical protein ABZP36_016086 [Zizania latifolia]
MEHKGLNPGVDVFNSIIKGFCSFVNLKEAGKFLADLQRKILAPTSEMFYAISAEHSGSMPHIELQFSVRHEQKLDGRCSYIKLFGGDVDKKTIGGNTPYTNREHHYSTLCSLLVAALLGFCHDTYASGDGDGYSYPVAAAATLSLCFPHPFMADDDDVVAAGRSFFPAPCTVGSNFLELGNFDCPL